MKPIAITIGDPAGIGPEIIAKAWLQAPEAVRETVAALLREQPALTGIVVHNEPVLQPLMDALRALGRRVPDDVSVVAVCPDELAERTVPAVSSVAIPAQELGRRAVDLLMAKLDEREVPEATLLAPRLTARASTARTPSGPGGPPPPASGGGR